jgi:oxygen-independent coproporphyrinogen-3 oxidase
LAERGYDHYEVSNFALPGSHSLHNSNYWTYQPYLGIGPSAHSFDGDRRFSNIANNALYIGQLEEGVIPQKEEVLTGNEKIGEYLLTTLRTQWGADLLYLQQTFNHLLSDKQKEDIATWIDEGLALYAQNNLILTNKGRLLADHLTMKLLP